MKLRATLGESFGTKKAKAANRAQERNRVDIDAMKGVTDHLRDRIQENTTSLPSKGPLSLCLRLIACFTEICRNRAGEDSGR